MMSNIVAAALTASLIGGALAGAGTGNVPPGAAATAMEQQPRPGAGSLDCLHASEPHAASQVNACRESTLSASEPAEVEKWASERAPTLADVLAARTDPRDRWVP